jgi:predicted outer membrane protein
MSTLNHLKTAVTAAGLLGLLAVAVVAQQDAGQLDRPRTQQTERSGIRQADRSQSGRVNAQFGQRDAQGVAGAHSQEVENYLANCLLMKNKAEIEFAEFAQQQAQSQEVKQFAQKLIQDHGQLVQKLQPLAGMNAANRQSSTSTRVDNRQIDAQRDASDTTRLPGSPGAARNDQANQSLTATTQTAQQSQGGGALHQLTQIEKQIGERYKQAFKEELQSKNGAEFDKCYVGAMIGSHMHSLAALEVIGQQTQGQLAEVAQQAQPIVQQHLDHAKQLAKQLEGTRPGAQAERQQPSRTQR